MKLRHLPLIAVAFLASCSSSSEGEGTTDNPSASDYFPLRSSNYWTYEINDASGNTVKDSLYISNDTLIASTAYKKFKAKDFPTGFYSNSLNKNGVRKSGDQLLASGTIGITPAAQLPININLSDFIIFKENAAPNQLLSTVTGVMQQTVQEYPLTIEYKVTSKAGNSFSNYISPNGDPYTNVKAVNTIVNLKVSTVVFGITFVVLPSQDVLISTQYFSKDIGVVHTNTNLSYQLAAGLPPGISLPIPSSANQTQQEYLDVYHIN